MSVTPPDWVLGLRLAVWVCVGHRHARRGLSGWPWNVAAMLTYHPASHGFPFTSHCHIAMGRWVGGVARTVPVGGEHLSQALF